MNNRIQIIDYGTGVSASILKSKIHNLNSRLKGAL